MWNLLPGFEVLGVAQRVARPVDRISGGAHNLKANPLEHADTCASGICKLPQGLIESHKSLCVEVVQGRTIALSVPH